MEMAITRALSEELGGAEVAYCAWHWARAINCYINPRNGFHYLDSKLMSRKYGLMFRMVHSLVHLPLHNTVVRVAAIDLIKKEMYLKKTKSKEFDEVRKWHNYLRSEYLSDSSNRPYFYWAPKTIELGCAYNTTSACESINSMIKKRVGFLIKDGILNFYYSV